MDYAAIQIELLAGHPISGAYNVDDKLAADQMNVLNIIRVRSNMTGAEFLDAADNTEYGLLSDVKKTQFLSFVSGNETIDPKVGGITREIIKDIFGVGSTTVTTLGSISNETVSRATELGFGKVVIGDIQNARAL